ncbi:MAG: acetyl-CoA carboxylase biotin carboxyl carrier protein [Deltaproteobacteria bacterium]|nr:acetyl-CoA carboxylase biotin carboxyl carrier protein [Deltaproteobacteria bacterium]
MDVKELKKIIDMVTDTDIVEFEMENSDQKIVIRRGRLAGDISVGYKSAVQAEQVAVAATSPPGQEIPPQTVATAVEGTKDGLEKIKSPIVGTFYRAPSPDSPSYVEVGDVVEKGQVFCIVEAMKLMNEIEAEFKCRVKEILKENAQPVEFGDILFHVERI